MKFCQRTLPSYLDIKREKILEKAFDTALQSGTLIEGGEAKDQVGEMMMEAMEKRRRFLRSLPSSKTSNASANEKILKRGYVDLALIGPSIGLNGRGFMPLPTETLQTTAIRAWIEGYWRSYAFRTRWFQRDDCPDAIEEDWPRQVKHIVQGPSTPIWVLRISW